MIGGYLHEGSGLGNQIFRYITTRALAKDKGVEYGMIFTPDGSGKGMGFKGNFFLEQPKIGFIGENPHCWEEKKVVANGVDIRGYDPEINFVEDNTIIDGEFQDAHYWSHRLGEINDWLRVKPAEIPKDLCVIGFRGGEYKMYPDLFLTKEYWDNAVQRIRLINPNMKFYVVTDDPKFAVDFFEWKYPVHHEIGEDWKAIRYAKYTIIANSSFYIIPRLLKHLEDQSAVTIAPRYWARRNTKTWALPQNWYSQFTYI